MDQGLGPCIWVRLNPDLNWCEILRFVKFGQRFLFPWALLLQLLLWKCSNVIIINHVMLISQSNPCSQTLSHLRLDCQWARITMQKGMDNTVWSKRKWMTHKLFFVVVVFFSNQKVLDNARSNLVKSVEMLNSGEVKENRQRSLDPN